MLRRTKIRDLEERAACQARIISRLRDERDQAQAAAAQWEARAHRFAGDRVNLAREDAEEMALLTKERDEARALCRRQERIIGDLQATNENHYRELAERAGAHAADAHIDIDAA